MEDSSLKLKDVQLLHNYKDMVDAAHADAGCSYDMRPYRFHLEMALNYGYRYLYILPEQDHELVLKALYGHDLLEDTSITESGIKATFGEDLADIIAAVTKEHKETPSYYERIHNTPYATFVKVCDRLANATYSKLTGSDMYEVYRSRHAKFREHLYCDAYAVMFNELDKLFAR